MAQTGVNKTNIGFAIPEMEELAVFIGAVL